MGLRGAKNAQTMKVMKLRKTYSGRYSANENGMIINIEANYVSGVMDGGWMLDIDKPTHIAKDMSGLDVQITENIFHYPCDSKSQAVKIANQLIANL